MHDRFRIPRLETREFEKTDAYTTPPEAVDPLNRLYQGSFKHIDSCEIIRL